MRYSKEVKLIDDLVNLAEIETTYVKDDRPKKSITFHDYTISFIGFDNLKQFEIKLEILFKIDKEITQTYTYKTFETQIIYLVKKLIDEHRSCEIKDFVELIDNLLSAKIYESEVLSELYGGELNTELIKYGDFTIYNIKISTDYLVELYPTLKHDFYFDNLKSNLLIGIKVKAREHSKAVEIANDLFEIFENMFNYAVADFEHHRMINILNYKGWESRKLIICNKESMGTSTKMKIITLVKLEDVFFKDSSQGNDIMWQLITKPNKNEIEKRLLNAISWIGKAIYDDDTAKSLVQFVIAMEGMLQQNEKDFITSSIVSQISDWLAFIISDKPEERHSIAGYFKDIYQKRSAIAHGANKNIDIDDLKIAYQIAKSMTITFLTKEPFNEIASIKELSEYLKKLKYK